MKFTVSLERIVHNGGGPQTAPHAAKLVLHSAPGEVAWHIALKLLGYTLFMDYAPRIEEGIGWHYKPDLVALDAQGQVRLWVDCGNIAVRKIERVAVKVGNGAPFFILRRTHRDAQLLAQSLTGKMRFPERLRILSFDNGVVDALAAHLDTTNHIRAHIGILPHHEGEAPATPRGFTDIRLTAENRRGALELHSTIVSISP